MITPEQAQDMLHYESADGFTAPELCLTAELAAHAPFMAEQIASMFCMYAVQIEDVAGETRFAKSAHGTTSDIRDAWWTTAPNVALADHWRESKVVDDVRIVRRLVSDVEVVE